jgi:tyrosyl-tRNA synthetase
MEFKMNGKGSKPRSLSVDRKEFENNWDKVFSRKKMTVLELLKKLNATCSMAESRRLIASDSISLNGSKIQPDTEFHIGDVIQVGKHKTFEVKSEHLI